MKTVYYTAVSLDGYIADADNSLDWLFQFAADGTEDYPDFIAGIGALAMGSTTYEWVLDHLERTGEPWPYSQRSWVFTSRSLRTPAGADIRFVSGDVRPVHEEMAAAAGGKGIWLVGGGELVGQFHDHGLLDELIVTVASVTLGGGAPLLPRRISHPPLRLTSAKQLGDAFVQLRYEVPRSGAGR
jgi:dihydrofolate reductase